ncbi:aminodeoxychorismate/anthranilate synthase component II [bacterium (Candidatus Blackallbacteria) CG17_big_fil_post_rev_8_21_14_2_50_48_46]|uniref:Aminodeoxychorismate/anthranilate synthase component II n=1 Tax=bacterium (Candidatus Blackallbacteria) CG17_big_fil_post_rev_8_21_14_2_50_48_46 TaxID=2014261 RepID=A0A2M7FY88_9BACT|nr:MAG: aminodeoxychorismate/anthranilate synthase component II [bacterium (Candidatus Blackallbacteria) CG18_big_fil_WC_8_21_14_2_50_49_26]PIW14304.1 MAG: aminodeoxychorismate/anthranilate synthase component II [bacterium (Candidatus Blackallbacteria) CG17_big_fil_post_rev_8_21_14_2_50_48_46]PIW45573.1 MAG: aminodeoxychorismate/anthranilate synthase component II [bacterium (Candidatus Blackallbacteria) CG13_big_fil_rev_8_21_14_2_50_49_14]
MILIIDNYDSFVYNLYQALAGAGADCQVVRNDALRVTEVLELAPQAVVLSPGPGRPEQAGICLELITAIAGRFPLLGVCLGHQSIAQAFGGKIVRTQALHGKTSAIQHQQQGLFAGLPSPMQVARYHSLMAERESLPDCLEITAESEEGLIMGLRHRSLPIEGVQFHPESIATPEGPRLLKNFLKTLEVLV